MTHSLSLLRSSSGLVHQRLRQASTYLGYPRSTESFLALSAVICVVPGAGDSESLGRKRGQVGREDV